MEHFLRKFNCGKITQSIFENFDKLSTNGLRLSLGQYQAHSFDIPNYSRILALIRG
jgi:hypothetical protein